MLTTFALALLLGGDVPSGPMVGDKLPEFKVQGFSGPEADKEFELLKDIKGGPAALVIVHQITRPAFQLMRPLEEFASKHEKLKMHFVWLGEKEKMQEFLKRAENSLNINSPMSIAVEKEGPGTYGLNDRAALTILLVKDGKVVNNFAFSDPNATNARAVIQAMAKLIGVEAPKEEPKKKVREKATGGR